MSSEQYLPGPVAYLGHDVNDAAVRRRVALFRDEGVPVRLGGFRRGEAGAADGGRGEIVEFGKTADARLLNRAFSVLTHFVSPRRVRGTCEGARVLVARNLEMLVLAWRVRRSEQRLVYECLDIHRLMLGSGCKSRLMRWIERQLLARADLVVVSSPAYAREYFSARQGRDHAVLLVENKVPIARRRRLGAERRSADLFAGPNGESTKSNHRTRSSGRNVAIGWFGMLRCRRTLAELAAIASTGQVEVVIAGIASRAEFADFPEQVAACPGLRFLGPYSPSDLPALYGQVDYVWAIDYFEEGLNSEWLLPNRLYEGLAHGAVPIALRRAETGRWLENHGVGLLVDEPLVDLPVQFLETSDADWQARREAVTALPVEALYQTERERRAIVAHVMGAVHV